MVQVQKIWQLVRRAGVAWWGDNASRLAASLAYYTVISLAPLMVLTVVIVGQAVGHDRATQQVQQQMAGLVGTDAANAIHDMIQNAKHNSGVLATVVSMVVLLFGASGVFGELQASLNLVWGVRPKPDLGLWATVRARFLSMAMVLGIAFLLLVSLFVSTAISGLSQRVAGSTAFASHATDLLLSVSVMTVLFAAIFKVLPDVTISWEDVWLGAAVTAALFTIGKLLLGIYFAKASPASAYGAAGSLAALLIWVYYSAQIVFFGAEVTQVYAEQYGTRIKPAANAEPVTKEAQIRAGQTPHRTAIARQRQKTGVVPFSPSAAVEIARATGRPIGVRSSPAARLVAAAVGVSVGAIAGITAMSMLRRGGSLVQQQAAARLKVIDQQMRQVAKKADGNAGAAGFFERLAAAARR